MSEETETEDTPKAPTRVWVVEDNETLRRTVARVLDRQKDMKCVHQYERCEEAIEALVAGERPDVMLFDIGLPGRDGFELATVIRAMRKSVPDFARPMLIALTGYGQLDDRTRALEAGFDMHMVKPANVELICSAIAGGAADCSTRNALSAGASETRERNRQVFVDRPGSPAPKKRAPQNGARIDN